MSIWNIFSCFACVFHPIDDHFGFFYRSKSASSEKVRVPFSFLYDLVGVCVLILFLFFRYAMRYEGNSTKLE